MTARIAVSLCVLPATSLLLWSAPALAHHVMEGALPATFAAGLLSGLGHPVIGPDHLAFLLLAGLLAERHGRLFAPVAAFTAASLGGVLLHLAAPGLATGSESLVAFSVLLAGLLLWRQALPIARVLLLPAFALAGLAHGHAFGESILGAEATPLLAYLAGLALIQTALGCGAGLLLRRMTSPAFTRLPRLAGLGGAVLGGVFLLQTLLS